MSVVDVVGWIAAASSASLAIPQGVRIARLRSVAGLSTLSWQSLLLAGVAWTAHGLLYGTQQIIWPNVLLALTSAWVLWQITAARKLSVMRTWAPPLAYALIAFGMDALIGQLAFGVMAFIPGAIGQSAQLREILHVPDLSGVSMVVQVMGFSNQVLWFSFALPAGDLSVVSVSVPMGVLYGITVIALVVRRGRLAGAPRQAIAPRPVVASLAPDLLAPDPLDRPTSAEQSTPAPDLLVSATPCPEDGGPVPATAG